MTRRFASTTASTNLTSQTMSDMFAPNEFESRHFGVICARLPCRLSRPRISPAVVQHSPKNIGHIRQSGSHHSIGSASCKSRKALGRSTGFELTYELYFVDSCDFLSNSRLAPSYFHAQD